MPGTVEKVKMMTNEILAILQEVEQNLILTVANMTLTLEVTEPPVLDNHAYP